MSKRSFQKLPFVARAALLAAAGAFLALFFCLLFALIAQKSSDPTANLAVYGKIAYLITLFACGFAGAKTAADDRFTSGLAACGILAAALLLLSAFCSEAGILRKTILLLIGLFSGAIGSLLGAKEKKRKRRR